MASLNYTVVEFAQNDINVSPFCGTISSNNFALGVSRLMDNLRGYLCDNDHIYFNEKNGRYFVIFRTKSDHNGVYNTLHMSSTCRETVGVASFLIAQDIPNLSDFLARA